MTVPGFRRPKGPLGQKVDHVPYSGPGPVGLVRDPEDPRLSGTSLRVVVEDPGVCQGTTLCVGTHIKKNKVRRN